MKDANTIIEESVSQREEVYSHVRAAADFFHEHEGTFFERGEAIAQLSDELSIEQDIAGQVIAELVGDIVDPVVLSAVNGEKYVGVVEFEEFDGAYGYVDHHDVRGPDKRVVCQQCVNEASVDTQVAHATAGDPSGTISSGADYDELLEVVYEHYENSHDVVPEDVATGATLASGTTIGGNESWHAGNDGSGSGLDADRLDGNDSSSFASDIHSGQHESGGTDELNVTGLSGDLADAQDPKAHASTHTRQGTDTVAVDELGGTQYVYTKSVPGADADERLTNALDTFGFGTMYILEDAQYRQDRTISVNDSTFTGLMRRSNVDATWTITGVHNLFKQFRPIGQTGANTLEITGSRNIITHLDGRRAPDILLDNTGLVFTEARGIGDVTLGANSGNCIVDSAILSAVADNGSGNVIGDTV